MIVFIAAQVFFVLFHIFYQSVKIRETYIKQRLTNDIDAAHLQLDTIKQELAAQKDLKKAKKYATNKLHMHPLTVNEMSKVPDYVV